MWMRLSPDKEDQFEKGNASCPFAGMCVLAGCDFLPSVPGIGIKKAHSLVSKYRNMDRVSSLFASQMAI